MKVAVYQFSPDFGLKEKNLIRIEAAIRKSNADLIVLPELCTTGYQFVSSDEVFSLSEPIPDGMSIRRFCRICREKNIFIAAGIGEKEGDICYNSAVLVGPEGFIGLYRKVHLFLEEKLWFKPGNLGFRVWDIKKARIGLMICFDWIFPEAVRSLAIQGADIICHPANLVLPYCQNAMITRSIENRVFSITANRIGWEERKGKKRLTFTGGSQIVNPKGEVLLRMDSDVEEICEKKIDPDLARDKQLTLFNHIFKDRRPEFYSINLKDSFATKA